VLLLAYTNHALDHILRAVYDSDVTKSLARLGSRSKDEVIAGFTLEILERTQDRSDYTRDIGKAFKAMKLAEDVSHFASYLMLWLTCRE